MSGKADILIVDDEPIRPGFAGACVSSRGP